MASIRFPIKWYLTGFIAHPYYELLMMVVVLSQYYALFYSTGKEIFYSTSGALLIPLVAFYSGMHFARDERVTVFEISIFRSWTRLEAGRILSSLLSFVPFLLVELAFFAYYGLLLPYVSLIVSVLVFSALILISSLLTKFTYILVTLFLLLFLIPFSLLTLLSSYTSLAVPVPNFLAILSYVFIPMVAIAFYSNGSMMIAPVQGFVYGAASALSLMILYFLTFKRTEFKP